MEQPIKLVFITRKWAPATGGMETYSLRLCEALAKHCNLDVIALKGRKNGMPPGTMALLLFPIKAILHWLRRGARADVLHLGDMAIWPLGLLAGKQTSLFITAHGTDIVYGLRGHWRALAYGAYLALGRKLLPHARIITNSRATSQAVRDAGWGKAETIPLATDLTVEQLPQPDTRNVLFVGRLVERKGCAWFIQNVLPLLPQNITLSVIGPAWDEGEKCALADPRVRYLGRVPYPDLVRAYGEAACVVMPNIPVESGDYEGFGIVAPEAAAAGGIVLAARHGGLEDAVIDGETGMLLPPADAQAWADAITGIVEWGAEHRAQFQQRARRKVAEYYCWDRVARATRNAYDQLPS